MDITLSHMFNAHPWPTVALIGIAVWGFLKLIGR